MDIKKQILAKIKPSKEEEKKTKELISEFLKKLNTYKAGKAILGGSGAKNTWLSKTFDVDIFYQFPYKKYKDKSDTLSNLLEAELKKRFDNLSKLHGSRDYFQINYKGFTFEIVPILEIKKADESVNITDISPLHAKWVVKYKKTADEIRLLKQFCKANNIYGAESYIQGFSGYVCEILIANYGGFDKLIKAAAKWKEGEVVDVKKYFKNKLEVTYTLNKSKLQSPIIIIDPVQKTRNAAAAISQEKFNLFIKLAQNYLNKPSIDFFEEKTITKEVLQKKAGKESLIMLKLVPLGGKEDLVGCKILKSFEFFKQKIQNYGFILIDAGWDWKKEAQFYFIIKNEILSKEKEVRGPPINFKKDAESFKKKHKNIFIKEKALYAKVSREFTNVEPLIQILIKDEYLKDKIKEIKLM